MGEGVKEVKAGDLVVPSFVGNCGSCTECKSELTNVCAVGFSPAAGGLPRSQPSPFAAGEGGAAIHSFLGVSSFAEYTVVDVSQITIVDAAIPPEKACLLSCGVSTGKCEKMECRCRSGFCCGGLTRRVFGWTGVGAAWKVAAVERGSSVAVFGLGAVGLAVCVVHCSCCCCGQGRGRERRIDGGVEVWMDVKTDIYLEGE